MATTHSPPTPSSHLTGAPTAPVSSTPMDSASQLTALSDSDNASTACFPPPSSAADAADLEALRQLSRDLGSLFLSPEFEFCADSRVVPAGSLPDDRACEVAAHRCMLAARSPFFRRAFGAGGGGSSGGVARVELGELVKEVEVGHDALVAVLGYLYTGQPSALPVGVCACADEECAHVACWPVVDFMVQALYASFVFQVNELVSLYQRHLLDIIEKVDTDDILAVLCVANLCNKACSRLVTKCVEIVIKSDLDIVTLEKALPHDIVKKIMDSRAHLGLVGPEGASFPDKHVKRIHRALDSDDVELVKMLLKEGHTTLDDAYALHYAVAICDSKLTRELLDLGLADVNLRNQRGYTVLHIAAMRKEPKIIVSLLTKGARPSDLTLDGRKALQIAKRLTKSVDYYRSTEEGKSSHKDRLCIDILEQAERRDPLIGEASVSLAMAGDDLRVNLLYLENRVALAKLLFPMEAKVATDIAQVDGTLEFTLGSTSYLPNGRQSMAVDLNDTPFKIKEEHLSRIKALSRTVELGKHFFPRCSAVLDRIMDDELSDFTCVMHDASEERTKRYLELQDVLSKAFNEDKEELDKSIALSSPSSSTAVRIRSKVSKR